MSGADELDPWYRETLVCPVDRSELRQAGRFLVSENGRRYPIVDGMPVMLREDVESTIGLDRTSLELADSIASGRTHGGPPLYLETIGASPEERELATRLHEEGSPIDPVVAVMIGATSGLAYKVRDVARKTYPIPVLPFPRRAPGRFLDIGCNWGRWTIAAAKCGHDAVGIDPQLGAVLAARRVAHELGVPARFVVADGRHLPFRTRSFDYGWSYSVLQHFSQANAREALAALRQVIRPGGTARIQMASAWGLRSLYHMTRRGFREPQGFEVRYWTPGELRSAFEQILGPTRLSPDCFFGLGLQSSDFKQMNATGRVVLCASEALRLASRGLPVLGLVADSQFCTAEVELTSKER